METVPGYKNWTFEKVKDQFDKLFGNAIRYGINAKQIKEWIIYYSIRANMYCISPGGDVCLQYLYNGPNNHHRLIIIPFIVNNDHSYLIEDTTIINVLKSGHCKNINHLLPKIFGGRRIPGIASPLRVLVVAVTAPDELTDCRKPAGGRPRLAGRPLLDGGNDSVVISGQRVS